MYTAEEDYITTGFHNITITAENHVTQGIQIVTERIDVLYPILVPHIEIYTPTRDIFLVHPQDLIQFNVSVVKASRLRADLSCQKDLSVGLHRLSHYIQGSIEEPSIIQNNVDRVYCDIVIALHDSINKDPKASHFSNDCLLMDTTYLFYLHSSFRILQ